MKRVTLKIAASLLVGVSIFVSDLPAFGDDVVYNNTTTKVNEFYDPGVDSNGDGIQFGDAIILGGTSRRLTAFTFEYFLPIASGNESIRLRFYTENPNNQSPATRIFDSGFEHIGSTTVNGVVDGLTLRYDVANYPSLNIVAPDSFIWTVEFSGIDAGETAGLELYSPPTFGNSYTSFWQLNPDTNQWEEKIGAAGPMDFGARVEAVPEASPLMIGMLAGTVWLGVRGLRRKQASA